MKIKGNLQLKYKNSKTAKTVYESLEVDNIGFLESKLKNNTIEYELDNDSLETFLSTADDFGLSTAGAGGGRQEHEHSPRLPGYEW